MGYKLTQGQKNIFVTSDMELNCPIVTDVRPSRYGGPSSTVYYVDVSFYPFRFHENGKLMHGSEPSVFFGLCKGDIGKDGTAYSTGIHSESHRTFAVDKSRWVTPIHTNGYRDGQSRITIPVSSHTFVMAVPLIWRIASFEVGVKCFL